MTQNETFLEIIPSLSPAQVRALEAILTSDTLADAAAQAGVALSTIHRWKNEAAFATALAAAERQLVSDALGRLTREIDRSIDVILELRKSGDRGDAVRLKAAQLVLDKALELRKLLVIEEKTEKLEALVVKLAEKIK